MTEELIMVQKHISLLADPSLREGSKTSGTDTGTRTPQVLSLSGQDLGDGMAYRDARLLDFLLG